MKNINIFSIAWSEETYETALKTKYAVLDNRSNQRPDWYEFWPIRKYLIENKINDEDFYGFFSPKFEIKTGWKSEKVYEFVSEAINKGADVITFSPQPDQSSVFVNVFEHANFYFPGFKELAKEFFDHIGYKFDVRSLVMDSRSIVFSNYFVAKGIFWKEWLKIADLLYSAAEKVDGKFTNELNMETNYGSGVHKKVFLQEEIVSFLLSIKKSEFKCVPANLWEMGWGKVGFENYPEEIIILDALKIAFNENKFPEYINLYDKIRKKISI
jgi:hypothetical protein